MLGAKDIQAFDLDTVAVESAKQNIELNGVSNQVTVKQNNLLDGISGERDVIVANILAEVILRFTDQAYDLLKKDGYFITSGIIGQKKLQVKTALEEAGFDIVEVLSMEDWVSIIAKK
ncbi:ribosomal protein L11 methyltransferase [Bacillus safensis FO-36b] [Bacillus safensis subsp. safensis]